MFPGVRRAILSAFGCGAFGNPAIEVARIYKEVLGEPGRLDEFDHIVFAVFRAGYGPNNFSSFHEVLSNLSSVPAIDAGSESVQRHQSTPNVGENPTVADSRLSPPRGNVESDSRLVESKSQNGDVESKCGNFCVLL